VRRRANIVQTSRLLDPASGCQDARALPIHLIHARFISTMPDKQMVNMLYDAGLLKRIDDFRFQHRFESRTEAIRWLIQAALDKRLKPAKGE
jgi:hypothetical protein